MNADEQGRDQLVEDLYEAATATDPAAAPAPAESAQAPEAAAETPVGATPEPEPSDAAPAAAAEAAQVPGASDPQQPFTPPDRGDPLTIRVDGVDIPVPDARRIDGFLVIPERSFARVVQTRLADRGRIREREQGYQREIADLRAGQDQRIKRAEALTARFQELLTSPEKLEAFVADYQRNAPLLMAQAEKDLLQRELDERRSRESEAAEQREIDEATPQLQQTLRAAVDEYLTEMQAGELTPEQRHQIAKAIWEGHADRIFTRKDGRFTADEDYFRDVAGRELARAEAALARQQQTATAAKQNQAAVAPTQPGRVATPAKAKTPTPGRDQAGRFEKAPKQDDDFDKDEWLSKREYEF